jgi:hypothetical protein
MKRLIFLFSIALFFFSCENREDAQDPCTADPSVVSVSVKTSTGPVKFTFPVCTAVRKWDYYFTSISSKYRQFYSYYPETMEPYYPFVKITALCSGSDVQVMLYADANSSAQYVLDAYATQSRCPITETSQGVKLYWTGMVSPQPGSSGILLNAPLTSITYP